MSDALPPLHHPDTPAAVRADMQALRAALDEQVPPKRETSRNILIGTWNIRAFGSLSEVWTSKSGMSPQRDWRALWAIAEVVSRFDVVAIQEVRGNLKALRTLMKTLGPGWSFLITDVTRGKEGNSERMAFVFDARRLQLSGLAGELVVAPEWLVEIGPDALRTQFARTPYAVSLRAANDTFVLVTAHIKYGDDPRQRAPELRAIARWMAEWAEELDEYRQNLILLGDFNIDRHGDELWQAFTSTGLTVPSALNAVPRSIFADPERPLDKHYDQIAWFETGAKRRLNLAVLSAGGFDFAPFVYGDAGLTRMQISHRVSDHLPLWTEFESRRS